MTLFCKNNPCPFNKIVIYAAVKHSPYRVLQFLHLCHAQLFQIKRILILD